jgi:hypothetical protein
MRFAAFSRGAVMLLQWVGLLAFASWSLLGACDDGSLQPSPSGSGGASGSTGGSAVVVGAAGSSGGIAGGGGGGIGGMAGSGFAQPACGTIGTASNTLVVTVNGATIDFSDAAVTFGYVGEGYHSVALRKGEVEVVVTLSRAITTCPATHALPTSVRAAPSVVTTSAASGATRVYDPSAAGATGTFTFIGTHVVTVPDHHTYGVAFSCADCVLPESTGGGGSAGTARLHGEVHVINPAAAGGAGGAGAGGTGGAGGG